jgi:hypothetical protein
LNDGKKQREKNTAWELAGKLPHTKLTRRARARTFAGDTQGLVVANAAAYVPRRVRPEGERHERRHRKQQATSPTLSLTPAPAPGGAAVRVVRATAPAMQLAAPCGAPICRCLRLQRTHALAGKPLRAGPLGHGEGAQHAVPRAGGVRAGASTAARACHPPMPSRRLPQSAAPPPTQLLLL